jgi:hypothetical protein
MNPTLTLSAPSLPRPATPCFSRRPAPEIQIEKAQSARDLIGYAAWNRGSDASAPRARFACHAEVTKLPN